MFLTGCASFNNALNEVKTTFSNIVTPSSLDSIESSYGSALAVAVGYRDLCQRKVINKSCWLVIAKIQPYENKAYNAVLVLRKFVKSNPTMDATSFIQLAVDAINAFKTVQIQNGVN